MLRIYFADFWNGFNPEKSNIGYAIRQVFPEAIYLTEPTEVDMCVFSVFGNQHASIEARHRISYQGEPGPSTIDSTDLAIGFDYPKNAKEFRCPIWKLGLYENHDYDVSRLVKYTQPRVSRWSHPPNTTPIGAVYSNPRGFRCEVIPLLAQYGLCASYGNFYRTHLPTINDKEWLVQQHPFHLSFEALQREGYVSEKLKDALLNDSLPFYWGDRRGASEDFNPEAFFDLSSLSEGEGQKALALMTDVLRNESLCQAMRKAPVFKEIPDMNPLYDAIRNVVSGYD